MSRAEMFLEFWVDLLRGIYGLFYESISFLAYYVAAGFDLWGDNTLFGFVGMALVCWVYLFRKVWPETEFSQGQLYDAEWTERCAQEGLDPSIVPRYERIKASLFFGAVVTVPASMFGWVILNFVLGFFFGPVRT